MTVQNLIEWIKCNKAKVVALIIACFYVASSMIYGSDYLWVKVVFFLVFPLACVFFGEAMGGYTGMSGLGRPAITRATPGCFIVFAGWLLLLMPLIWGFCGLIFQWESLRW